MNVWRATEDYNRYANLIKDHSITQQQFEQASAAKQLAERQLDILQQQKLQASQQTNAVASQSNASASQIGVADATIRQREVDVDAAKLNLSYTVITATQDGQVSKVNVQPGQFVQAGQALFAIVHSDDVWVIGNFKETQLNKMTEGQKVIVKADANDGQFALSVRDTGPGISADDQAKLFQEFQQADNSRTSKKEGTGLGLAISKRIVEMHGGKIWLESQLGHGSTFFVTLPLRAEEQVKLT